MHANHVGLAKQLLLGDDPEGPVAVLVRLGQAHLARHPVGLLLRQARAPAHDLHAPRLEADLTRARPQAAEAHQPKRLPGQPRGHARLPPARLDAAVVGADVARQRQHQRPRVLDGVDGAGGAAGSGAGGRGAGAGRARGGRDDHAVLRRHRHVEGVELRARHQQQLQVGQALEQRARERRALAHRRQHGEGLQPRDQSVVLRRRGLRVAVRRQRVGERGDAAFARRDVGEVRFGNA